MYSFKQIIGNENIIKNMQSAIKTSCISHAYIIEGGHGMGKKLIANTFAKTLNCIEGKTEPCEICSSCHSFETKNNPDIFYVIPKKSKTLGVEDIREQIIKNVDLKQYKYKYKIFIVDKADSMTDAAQNAFLKTLEEPPQYAVFLLLAENTENFLPTVLSRCIIFKLKPLNISTVAEYIKLKTNVDLVSADVFAEYSQGSIGLALKLLSSNYFSDMRNNIINCLETIPNKNIADVIAMASSLEQYKNNYEILDIAYMWYRDLMALKSIGTKYIIQKDMQERLLKQAENETMESLFKSIDAVFDAKRQLEQNTNFKITIEVMFIKIKGH